MPSPQRRSNRPSEKTLEQIHARGAPGTPKDKVVLREVIDRTVANLLFHRYDPGEKQHVSDGGPCDVPNADDPAAGGKAVKVEPESDAA